MKVHVEIDCTPEEARTFMGLPDVGKANEVYVDLMAKAMCGVGSIDKLQEVAGQMAPMGQIGLKFFQNFMEGATGAGGAKPRKPGGETDPAD